MPENETNENVSFDAQRLTEEIETGAREEPTVDVRGDYERSKEYAVSEGAKEVNEDAKLQGEQEMFLSMAQEIASDSDK